MTVKHLYIAVSIYNKLIDKCIEYDCGSYSAFNCVFCSVMSKKRKALNKVYKLHAKLQANKILRGRNNGKKKSVN